MSDYLTFMIGKEICAVGIEAVESVLEAEPLTAIPGSPDHVLGLLNLRGNAIPVMDVRRRLRLEARESREKGSIIVLNLKRDDRRLMAGALVDSVCEVIQLSDAQIVPIDDFAVSFDRSVVQGIGKKDDHFIVIIAVDCLYVSGAETNSKEPVHVR